MSHSLEQEHQRILRKDSEYGKAVEVFLAARVSEEALENEVENLEEKRLILDEALARIAQGMDPYTTQAVSLIRSVILEGEKDRAQRLVEASGTAEDDRILGDIRALEGRIEQAQDALEKANDVHKRPRARLDEAIAFREKVQRHGLGRANRSHSGRCKDDVAGAILAGQGLGALLRRIQSQVRVISSSPTYPTSRPSRRSSSSGGFGGFGGRSGGGF